MLRKLFPSRTASKPRSRLRRLLRPRNWLIAGASFFIIFLVLNLLFPLPPPKPYSTTIHDKKGSLIAAYLSEDDKWRMEAFPEEISTDLCTAIIAKEDRYFYYHPGVNPFAILRAVWSNATSGRRVSGASTITMQVARMMEPKRRTIGSKLIEIFRAMQLEWRYSKAEILSMYLSYLPYGGNIEGVPAASYIYFGRPPSKLSLSQATLLTVIPNRPNSLRLDTQRDAAQNARDKWLRKFEEDGTFPADQVQAALAEPVTAFRRQLQPQAPHFCQRILGMPRPATDRETRPASQVHTTLDPELQATAETLLANYIRRARSKGISNGAVLVVDNAGAEVRAYCGSADFEDEDAAGQVDGVRAIRSPGSTLKPTAYAMAFDEGLLTPASRMLDIPSTWRGYSPANYDNTFRGPVSVSEALRHSLNVTAVQTLEDVGFERWLDLMERAGFRSIKRQREDLGLSAILGGCGVTLEELVRLFASFAHQGAIRPLAYHQAAAGSLPENPADSSLDGVPLFSPASAWLITDILSGIERPDLPNDILESTSRARIAWKTGTSYGRRDAWAIGYTTRYTVGVWIGNFDGQGVPDLSGASMAVPLLFDLFGAIQGGMVREEFPRPDQVWRREVCAETGDLPSENCLRTVQAYYIRDRSPRRECDQERLVYVSPDSSVQYCTGCLPESAYRKSSYPVFPPGLTLWYEANAVDYPKPPPHNPDCRATFDGPGPQIISPNADFEYLLESGAGQEIMLQAASDSRTTRHYWYVDGKFYRSAAPGDKVFYPAKRGPLRITCMDDRGRANEVRIKVSEY